MAGPSMDDMLKRTDEMREHMHRMQGSAEHLNSSFSSFFSQMVQAGAITRALEPLFHSMGEHVRAMAVAMGRTPMSLGREYVDRGKIIEQQLLAGKITRTEAALLLKMHEEQRNNVVHQISLSRAYNASSKVWVGYLGIAAAAMARMVSLSARLNENLIKANSDSAERNRLTMANLDTTLRTGQGFEDVLEAQRALLDAGFQTNRNYNSTVETVVRLHAGLGMSVQTAAELAVVVNNAVRGSFERVADVIANVVNQTALLADEVGHMTKELSNLLLMVRGQKAGELLPGLVQAVAKYEDALKRVGGTAGGVTSLFQKLSSPEGFGKAGMLGISSPELLTTQQGIDSVMRSFQRLGDSLVGESQGWQRRMGLEALAQMMGISADEASKLYIATKQVSAGVTEEISLRERFNQQSSNLAKTVGQLFNRLEVLLERGLYPFLQGLNFLASGLNRIVDTVSGMQGLVDILGYMVTAAVPLAVFALGALIRQLYLFTASTVAAKLGMEAGTGIGGIIKSLVTGVRFTGIGLLVAGITLVASILSKIYGIHKEASDAIKANQWKHSANLLNVAERERERGLFSFRYGQTDYAHQMLEKSAADFARSQMAQGVFGDALAQALHGFTTDMQESMKRGVIAQYQFNGPQLTSTERDDLNKKVDTIEAAGIIGDKFIKGQKATQENYMQMHRDETADANLKWYQRMALDLTYGLRHPSIFVPWSGNFSHFTDPDDLKVK